MIKTNIGVMDPISRTEPIAKHDFQCHRAKPDMEPHIIRKGSVHVKVVYRMRKDRKNKKQENHRYCPDCWAILTADGD